MKNLGRGECFRSCQPINQSPSRLRGGWWFKTMSSDGTRDGAGLGAGPVDVASGCASAPRLRVAVNVLSPNLFGTMLVSLTCRLQAHRPTTTLNTFAFLRISLDLPRSLHGKCALLCLLLSAELKKIIVNTRVGSKPSERPWPTKP